MLKETTAFRLANTVIEAVEDDRASLLSSQLLKASRENALMALAYILSAHTQWLAMEGKRLYPLLRSNLPAEMEDVVQTSELADEIKEAVETDSPMVLVDILRAPDKSVALLALASLAEQPEWLDERAERLFFFIRNMDKSWEEYKGGFPGNVPNPYRKHTL